MNAKYITPAVTAFDENGEIDYESLKKLYDHIITGGIDGILVLGSIGEFFAIPKKMKEELIRFAVKYINKRTELIIGTTSMDINETIELSRYALNEGANAVIIIPPYYFALNDDSVEEYYDRIADSINGNLYIYNFPDRTGYDVSPDVTVRLLRKHKNIIGYKDTTAGMDHTRELIKKVKPEFPKFYIYSGFDDNFARNILSGGDGCIAGLSNLVPELLSGWAKAFRNNDLNKVSEISKKVDRLMDIYSVGQPFVPYIKKALVMKGIIKCDRATFPLPSATKEQEDKLARIMKECSI